jgi:hypothetical protein
MLHGYSWRCSSFGGRFLGHKSQVDFVLAIGESPGQKSSDLLSAATAQVRNQEKDPQSIGHAVPDWKRFSRLSGR